MKSKLTLISLLLFITIYSFSVTIKVPSEYPTIQAGMDAANPGDTVLVAEGTYTGNGNLFLSFVGKAIVIKSENGPENCIIDCVTGTGIKAFMITNGETRGSVVEGFKIINGCWVIFIENSSPTIKNNIFENNNSGVYCGENSNPLVENNAILQSNENGIYCNNSEGIIQNNTISESKRSGINSISSSPIIDNNQILENKYHGIYCNNSSGIIQNNTIINSWRTNRSGIHLNNISSPTIKSNVLNYNYWGIYCGISCNPVIENNTISNSYSYGISCNESSPIILSNQIIENTSTGIYCNQSSPEISRNLIKKNGGNSFYSTSYTTYDNHNRPFEIFVGGAGRGGISLNDNSNPNIRNNIIAENKGVDVGAVFCDNNSIPFIVNNHIIENSSIYGGSVYVKNDSAKIVNNIIAGAKSSDSNNRLSRWYKDNVFARYTYDGAKLDYVTYYFGFINNGSPGEVQISGCTGLNKLVWAETGERFWVEAKSDVDQWGNGGGLYAIINLNSSGFTLNVKREVNWIPHGCNFIISPVVTSYGITAKGMVGAGIVVTDSDNVPEIAYNNIFGNSGGGYAYSDTSETKSVLEFDLTGTNGNISEDPIINEVSYELLDGSPCINAGTPDTTGLSIGLTDYFDNSRVFNGIIDIGAIEMQSSSIETQEYVSICQGEEYEGWTETGDYERTFTSSTGNDSIVTTHLTVHPIYETEEDISICEGENYLGLTTAGEHRREFETVNGCDSVVVTNLTVNPIYETEENVSICDGDDYLGIIDAGEHRREFETVNGCDSVVVTHLTINPVYQSEENVSICDGENYLGLTEEGDYSREFETVNGCDSTVITHLTVNPSYNLDGTKSICQPETFKGYSEPGQYNVEIKTVNGCDSIVISLTIHPSFKPTFTNYSDTLTSDVEYEKYQWYDSDGAIEGATSREFVISKSDEYYFGATHENGCTFLSDSKSIFLTNIKDFKTGEFTFSIMPNPNQGMFRFRIDSNPPEKLNVKLINGLGQIIETRNVENPAINQIEHFNVSHLSKGIYHFVLKNEKTITSKKIIIQ